MRWFAGALVLLVVAGLVSWVAAPGGTPLELDFKFLGQVRTSAWIALFGAFAMGAFVAATLCLFPIARLALRGRSQRRQIGALEQEVHGLRTLPLEAGEARPGTTLSEG